jgi:FAD-dependent oxidoreductase domain-containing protein 1
VTAEDHSSLWEELVWPAVSRLIPRLQDARVVSAWAGFYDYCTHDQNALFGRHVAGGSNVIYATGFSGHGIQQAAGAGRAIAELLVHNRYVSIDVSRLSTDRYWRGERVKEEAIV